VPRQNLDAIVWIYLGWLGLHRRAVASSQGQVMTDGSNALRQQPRCMCNHELACVDVVVVAPERARWRVPVVGKHVEGLEQADGELVLGQRQRPVHTLSRGQTRRDEVRCPRLNSAHQRVSTPLEPFHRPWGGYTGSEALWADAEGARAPDAQGRCTA